MSNGLITLSSPYNANETVARLELAIAERGLEVFATIDHARAAESAGLSMRPARVLIFGSAKAGTPLMQLAPTLAIDLPLRILVWADEAGEAWITYNAPAWLAHRHSLGAGADSILAGMARILSEIAGEVVRPPAP